MMHFPEDFGGAATLLRAKRLQRGAQPDPAEGGVQISENPHDSSGALDFHQAVTPWVIER